MFRKVQELTSSGVRSFVAVEMLEGRRLLASGGFGWAYALSSLDAQDVSAQVTDKSGNLYVAGTLTTSAVDFNLSPRKAYRLDPQGASRKFLAKYSSDGALVWARLFAAAGVQEVGGLAIHKTSGDLLMVGSFDGAPNFNDGGTTDQAVVVRTGEEAALDGFLLRINQKTGNVRSGTRTWGGATADEEHNTRVASDASGNIYVSGDSVRPDPNGGFQPVLHRAFVQKLDAALSPLWSESWGPEQGSAPAPGGLAVDAAGNAYLAGSTTGTTDFKRFATVAGDTITGPASYLVKFGADGTFAWAKTIGGVGASADRPDFADLAVDAKGNVLAVGAFAGRVDFNPTSKRFELDAGAAGTDAFLAKYSPSGGLFYARQIGADTEATDGDRATRVALDSQGYIYVGGTFAGTTRFNPGVSKFRLTPADGQDAFVAKYFANGTLVDAWQLGGSSDDEVGVLNTGVGDAVFVSGRLRGGAFDADPGPRKRVLTAADDHDAYVVKLV